MSRNSFLFLNSYFLIIPLITALLPPSDDFRFSYQTPPTLPITPYSTTIIFISTSLQLKDEGDIHREGRVGMMMGLSIGRIGVTWWFIIMMNRGDMMIRMMMDMGGMVIWWCYLFTWWYLFISRLGSCLCLLYPFSDCTVQKYLLQCGQRHPWWCWNFFE